MSFDQDFLRTAGFSAMDVDFKGDMYALGREQRQQIFNRVKETDVTKGKAKLADVGFTWEVVCYDQNLMPVADTTKVDDVSGYRLIISPE